MPLITENLPEEMILLAENLIERKSLQRYAIHIALVEPEEVETFCDTEDECYGGCQTQNEYLRAKIKLNRTMTPEKIRHNLFRLNQCNVDRVPL